MTETWLSRRLAGEISHGWRKSPSILELESTGEGVRQGLSQPSFPLESVHVRGKITIMIIKKVTYKQQLKVFDITFDRERNMLSFHKVGFCAEIGLTPILLHPNEMKN